MLTGISHHLDRLVELFYEMKIRRFSRGVDCFLLIEESLPLSFKPKAARELAFVLFQLWRLPLKNAISWSAGDFC